MSRFLRRLVAAVTICVYSVQAIAASCVKVSDVCVEGPSTKIIGGFPVTRACWKYDAVFKCLTGEPTNECSYLLDQGCSQVGQTCVESDGANGCMLYDKTFQCTQVAASQKQVTDCGTQKFCSDGKCFDTGHPNDGDLGRVVATMEAAREAGTYFNPSSQSLFTGTPGQCADGYFGIKRCCKTSGGAQSNSSVFGPMLVSAAAKNGFDYLVTKASPYVYDAMFSSDVPFLMDKAVNAWSANGWSPQFNPSFSYMGFTVSTSATAPASMIGSNMAVGEGAIASAGQTNFYVYFNPTMFAFAVAVMVIQQLAACTEEEGMLGMRRGANLCSYVGSYCSVKVPILGCLETTQSYCCFNSRLARIVNEQGRAQIGKGWGAAESPQCSGFTQEEFATLDFSKIDLSEFIAEIIPRMPDTSAISAKNDAILQNKVKGYYSGK